MLSRRSLIQRLGTIGAGSLLLSPSELLALTPEQHNTSSISDKQIVRLATNENPYAPSAKMKEILANMDNTICRYPYQIISEFQEKIAKMQGLPKECIVVTSGSREGLNAVGLLKAIEGGEIACCLPTYRALLTYAERWGAKLRVSPLKENFDYNLPAIEASINDNTRLAFICNPNNPTGTLLPADELEAGVRSISDKVTTFVDEVYFDYIDTPNYPSMKHLIMEGRDIIIARTLSKIYGLAGVRIGYLMTTPENAEKIRKAQMSGTNVFGIKLGEAALDDEEFKTFCLRKNKECRDMIYEALDRQKIQYLKSHTNFVFFKTGRPIEEIQKEFEANGVLVGRAFPPYMDWCRVSTGTIDEVEKFVEAVPKVFG